MFRKLKWKLVRFNMALLSLVFAAIFAVTAALMIVSNQRQTDFMLDRAFHMQNGRREPPLMGVIMVRQNIFGELEILSMPPDISTELVEEAAGIAAQSAGERGDFTMDGYVFAYARQDNSSRIVLLDQTNQRTFLRNTLLILLCVSALSLLLLFALSVLFANRTVKPVRDTFERQKNFVADASHELKTPLAILSANLSVVEGNTDETVHDQLQWLSAMRVQLDRMSGLVNDMLTLAKLDHEQDGEPLRTLDFSRQLTGCLLSFEAVAFEKEVEIHSYIEDALTVAANPEKLSRLIYILLDNAVKHTPPRGWMEVRLYREKNHAVLRVENSGEEIPAEALPHVFDRFYRADSARARETGGYGLGLAIAKAIVEEAHGKIRADSGDGRTVFTAAFPLGST
ncbi:ATP-binding protein [Clostridium sp. D33t1_170424_F3]|uniref:sensor histidine kinase n=1 Tax=Clostridium sp. D33t1_170424_F3 TaxID=2787099 RepID=UPI0018A96880|nr:ATP-binding protein [Clostridium sp. D33t1_170424_F3]